jgi:hypothetical protein
MFTVTTKKAAELSAFAEFSAKQKTYPAQFQFAPDPRRCGEMRLKPRELCR